MQTPIAVVIDTSSLRPILTRREPPNHPLCRLWQSRVICPMVTDETIQELARILYEASPTAKPLQAQRFVTQALRHYLPWTVKHPSKPRTRPRFARTQMTRCSSTWPLPPEPAISSRTTTSCWPCRRQVTAKSSEPKTSCSTAASYRSYQSPKARRQFAKPERAHYAHTTPILTHYTVVKRQ